MTHRRLLISSAIIALVVLVAFVLSVPHTRDLGVKNAPVVTGVPIVALKNTFKKGFHTIKGTVTVPNACTPVSTTASLLGEASSTTGILVALTFQTDTGMCLQVPTGVAFETSIAAPVGAPIEVRVNDAIASTTPL